MKQYLLYICALLLAACADEVTPPTAPQPAGSMCFTVEAGETRVKDDMYRATFQNGDKVGCVIAAKQNGNIAYQVNSEWEVHDGNLLPKYVNKCTQCWMADQDHSMQDGVPSTDADGNIIQGTDMDLLIAKDLQRDPQGTKGYIKLLQTYDYCFYFYYPYLSEQVMIDTLRHDKMWSGLERTNLPYVLYDKTLSASDFAQSDIATWHTNAHRYIPVGPANSSDWQCGSGHKHFMQYNWTAYPAFVCLNQNENKRNPEAVDNYTRPLTFSNWMWTSATVDTRDASQPINQTTATHTFPLVFHKKMGAIEIISQDPITNAQIDAPEGLVSGVRLNLQTGVVSQYTYNSNGSVPEKACRTHFTRDGGGVDSYPFQPHNLGRRSDNLYHKRLILPPQTFKSATLTFTLLGLQHTIAIGQNIKQIEENKLYIIRLDRQGDPTFIIRNWQDDEKDILLDLS